MKSCRVRGLEEVKQVIKDERLNSKKVEEVKR